MSPRQHMGRRELLLGGAALAGWSMLPGRARAWASPRLPESERSLLIVQLAGGNDGLNTVVPYGDDAYHAARPTLAMKAEEVLPIDDYRGLHPMLVRLRAEYEQGRLAVIEGAGYPEPTKSHFRSFDVWHAADLRGRGISSGWIGRLCDARFADRKDPSLVVHVGNDVPYSLHSSTHPPTSFVLSRSYRWAGEGRELQAYEDAASGADPEAASAGSKLELLRRALADGQSSSSAIRRATASYQTPVDYPGGPFAGALREVAGILNGDVGSRVFSVELDGFDTHADEEQRHRILMRTLDGSLGAFLEDVRRTPAGRNLVVMVFSEFGRRVVENGARGTDHGTAAPMFVAGAGVKGGLFGKHPSLTELEDDELRYTTDFRSVYGTLISEWFGADAKQVLGAAWPTLPFV